MGNLIIGMRLPSVVKQELALLTARAQEILGDEIILPPSLLPSELILIDPVSVNGYKQQEAVQVSVMSTVQFRDSFSYNFNGGFSIRENGRAALYASGTSDASCAKLTQELLTELSWDPVFYGPHVYLTDVLPAASRVAAAGAFVRAFEERKDKLAIQLTADGVCIFYKTDAKAEWSCDCYALRRKAA